MSQSLLKKNLETPWESWQTKRWTLKAYTRLQSMLQVTFHLSYLISSWIQSDFLTIYLGYNLEAKVIFSGVICIISENRWSYLTSTSIYLWDRIKQLNTFGTWWSFHSSQNHIIQISSNIYIQTTCLLFHWWINTVNIINQFVSVVKLKLNKYLLVHILNSKKNQSFSKCIFDIQTSIPETWIHRRLEASYFFLDRRRHPMFAVEANAEPAIRIWGDRKWRSSTCMHCL